MQTNFFSNSGTRAVAIYTNDGGSFAARVYVNCRDAVELGDATLVARRFSTLNGATKWAVKQLAEVQA